MNFMVFWSEKANLTYLEIIDYLEYKWTEKEIHAFISRTDDIIIKISNNPYLFQQHKDNILIRQVVLHENVSLIYQISEDQKLINLITFWDNRQNPTNLKVK